MLPDLAVVERLLDAAAPAGRAAATEGAVVKLRGCENLTETEIREFFGDFCGLVTVVKKIHDVAFVEFADAQAARRAVAKGKVEIRGFFVEIAGQKEEIPRKKPQNLRQAKPTRIYISGLSEDEVLERFTEEDWRGILRFFGEVVKLEFPLCPYRPGTALGALEATYGSLEEAKEAVAAMHGRRMCGVKLKAGFIVE